MSFLEGWDKGQKVIAFSYLLFLESLMTSTAYIFNISNKAKVVSDIIIEIYCFDL